TVVPSLEEFDSNGHTQCAANSSFEQNCRLLVGGNQTLFVEDAAGPNSGQFSLYAQLSRSFTCTSIKFGKAVPATIASAGQTDCYKFAGVNGHRVRVSVAATDGSLVTDTQVVKPNGVALCETSSVIEQSCRLTADGNHTIYVSDVNGTQTGDYTIYVQD